MPLMVSRDSDQSEQWQRIADAAGRCPACDRNPEHILAYYPSADPEKPSMATVSCLEDHQWDCAINGTQAAQPST